MRDPEQILSDLTDLHPGSPIVHVDHGVGRYRGLTTLTIDEMPLEFLTLEYAGGDRYFLPVTRINLVQKYTGAGGEPTLSRLGGSAWTRTKGRARDAVMELARELLEVEAFRAVHKRRAFAEGGPDFEEFEAHFPFEETEGQKTAIADVVRDLAGEKPMDRLVCGDVGYGKTEVALRAAYLAALGGRQVAFLVPTTVLARQHFDTVRARFEGYPLQCAMLSRFNSREENARVVAGLGSGAIDLVVGTHRLLQKDVRFARLGLLVVDEEHRFGVAAKERIKRMRREVDVLTMTATPIPRTLQLALTGVRDLSLIETPPVDRLAIRTYVARHDEGLVKPLAQVFRDVGHALEGGDAAMVEPVPDLARPHAALLFRYARPGQRIGQPLAGHADQRRARIVRNIARRRFDGADDGGHGRSHSTELGGIARRPWQARPPLRERGAQHRRA